MKTHLKFDELYRLGCALCLKCGLTPPRRAALMDRYLAAVPQPLIVDGEDARVWIDKYYAAYQLGGGDVHYAYLSRTHLEEETRALKELAAQKGLFLSLCPGTSRAPSKAPAHGCGQKMCNSFAILRRACDEGLVRRQKLRKPTSDACISRTFAIK